MTDKNIFEKIGEKVRRGKDKNKKFLDKYWKLHANERLHYDSCYNGITYSKLGFGKITLGYIKVAVLTTLVVFMLSFVYSENLLAQSAGIFFNLFFIAFPFIFFLDIITAIVNKIIKSDQIYWLNKRFKLI